MLLAHHDERASSGRTIKGAREIERVKRREWRAIFGRAIDQNPAVRVAVIVIACVESDFPKARSRPWSGQQDQKSAFQVNTMLLHRALQ